MASMQAKGLVLSRTAVASIGATFLVMGLIVSSYGPLLEHLTRRFSVSLPVAGTTISIHFAGSLVGVVVAMRTMQVLHARTTVIAATGIVAMGCAGVALAPSWAVFAGGVSLIGLGFGALVIGLNQAVAYSQGARRAALLNALNGLYSAGAVAGPLVVAALAAGHFSALFAGAAVVALCLVPGATTISGRLPVGAGTPGRPTLLVLVFVVAFVLYVAIENGIGGWMTSHLESTGLHSATAAAFTSGFWLALAAGRFLATAIPVRIPEATIVLSASGVATVALLAASFTSLAPWAYVIAGFAMAPIFPTGVVWLATLYQGDARATSWLFPAASVGGIAGPGAIGLVIAGFGVRWSPSVLAAVAIGMSVAFATAARTAEARQTSIRALR